MSSKIMMAMISFMISSLGLWGMMNTTNDNERMETAIEVEVSGEQDFLEEIVVEEPINWTITVESSMPYYVRINRLQNVVNIYEKQEDGSYVPCKAMICSIGTATPECGEIHKMPKEKYRWSWLSGGVYGQYVTNIVGGIYFHSVPYTKMSNDSLEYWEYDKLGTAASLGCIRLTTIDAKWVYENLAPGTLVEFYEDEIAGPYGKPEAQKIAENEKKRGWDPTDDASGNPWNE